MIDAQVNKLKPGTPIDLFMLNLTPIGSPVVFYFHDGVKVGGTILFQGQEYTPWPIVVEGFEKRGSGAENRPKVSISNYQGAITQQVLALDDLVNAEVRRIRTLSQYLTPPDAGVPDSTKFSEEMYFIEQKTYEDSLVVEFELSTAMDFLDKELPGRIAVANACPWQYKSTSNGSGCSWPGTNPAKWYDRQGTPVLDQSSDVCGKRLSDCKLRFGENEPLDFGGFPSLGRF